MEEYLYVTIQDTVKAVFDTLIERKPGHKRTYTVHYNLLESSETGKVIKQHSRVSLRRRLGKSVIDQIAWNRDKVSKCLPDNNKAIRLATLVLVYCIKGLIVGNSTMQSPSLDMYTYTVHWFVHETCAFREEHIHIVNTIRDTSVCVLNNHIIVGSSVSHGCATALRE